MRPLRTLVRRPLPPRVAIVQRELDRFSSARYLEIGVDTGVLFLHLRAARKVGVDPRARVPQWKWLGHPNTLLRARFHGVSSDEYFASLDPHEAFEVIFVDGDHSFEQSLRDIEHALRHLAAEGVILVHDCNPQTASAASPDSADSAGGPWCGEVWRTVVHLRATREDLAVEVLDTDFGIGIVRRGDGPSLALEPEAVAAMSYADLAADRARLLGLRPAV